MDKFRKEDEHVYAILVLYLKYIQILERPKVKAVEINKTYMIHKDVVPFIYEKPERVVELLRFYEEIIPDRVSIPPEVVNPIVEELI